MKSSKRIIASTLAALMVSAAVSGCSGNNTASSTAAAASAAGSAASGTASAGSASQSLPLVSTTKTFKIAVYKHALDKSTDVNSKEIFKIAEKETNVHIDWTTVDAGSENDKVPVMMASDPPEAFLRLVTESVINKFSDQLLPLNDYLQKDCPNIEKQYATVDGMWDSMKFPDGNIYSLATNLQISRDDDGGSMLFMNKTWLDKLGVAIPTDTDAFEKALLAIKNGDPNGNGQADEIPLELCENNWAAGVMHYAGAWGISVNYYNIVNGKFTPVINTTEFRSFLEYMHKLAAEGLADVEGFSQTNQQYYSKLKSHVVGAYSGWTPSSNFDSTTAKEYVMVEPMSLPGKSGTQVKDGYYNYPRYNRTGFVITKVCSDPDTLLKWWDYLSSSTKLKFTFAYGAEGKIWQMDSSGQVWTIFPETASDYTRENMKYTEGMYGDEPMILASEAEKNDGTKYPDSAVRSAWTEQCKKYFQTEYLPLRFVSPEKNEEKTTIETDLNTYIKSFIANSVVNGIDDASWNTYTAKLKELKISDWQKWYQDFLDKKF